MKKEQIVFLLFAIGAFIALWKTAPQIAAAPSIGSESESSGGGGGGGGGGGFMPSAEPSGGALDNGKLDDSKSIKSTAVSQPPKISNAKQDANIDNGLTSVVPTKTAPTTAQQYSTNTAPPSTEAVDANANNGLLSAVSGSSARTTKTVAGVGKVSSVMHDCGSYKSDCGCNG